MYVWHDCINGHIPDIYQGKSVKMYSASNDQKFQELYHTIFTSMVALLKKTKEIMDKERNSQNDINKHKKQY